MSRYVYRLPKGLLSIRPHPEIPGSVELRFADEWVGTYSTAKSAADTVRSQKTGSADIDLFNGKLPYDLVEWTRL